MRDDTRPCVSQHVTIRGEETTCRPYAPLPFSVQHLGVLLHVLWCPCTHVDCRRLCC